MTLKKVETDKRLRTSLLSSSSCRSDEGRIEERVVNDQDPKSQCNANPLNLRERACASDTSLPLLPYHRVWSGCTHGIWVNVDEWDGGAKGDWKIMVELLI